MTFLLLSLFWAIQSGNAAPKAAPAKSVKTAQKPVLSTPVQDSLRRNVAESEPKLGALEDWQKKLFAEEVVPQFQTFVRDFKNSGKGVVADIDLASIKKYLDFYAPQKLGMQENQICIHYTVEPGCTKCRVSEESVKLLVQGRLIRRGYKPSWKDTCSGVPSTFDLSLKRVPIAEADEGHEDDRGYRVEAKLVVQTNEQSRKAELLENDSFDNVVGSILTEFFMELSGKNFGALSTGARSEIWIEFQGIKNFATFTELKNQLTLLLGALQERKMSSGTAVFAIPAQMTLEEVKAKLEGKIDPNLKVSVTEGAR